MKYSFTFIILFYISFSFGQLTQEGNEFIVKIIKKNNIEELIRTKKDFKIIKKICSNEKYSENSHLWGFSKLNKLVINIGYKSNGFYVITNGDDNSQVVYSYNNYSDIYFYNNDIVLYIEQDWDNNVANLILKNKNQYLIEKQIIVNTVNKRLETFNNKSNLENSFLIKNIYETLDSNIPTRIFKLISTNIINKNIEEELKRLNFKYIKNQNGDYDLCDESYFEEAKLYNKKLEDAEKEERELEYKKNNPTGIVENYKKNGYNYTGSLVNGIYEGQGVLTKSDSKYINRTEFEGNFLNYTGSFKNGLYDGYGKLSFEDGRYSDGGSKYPNIKVTYEGNFKDGKYDGYGKLFHYDKKITYSYEGEFKNGAFEGKGKITHNPNNQQIFENIYKYDGQWKNGKYNGIGTIETYDYNNPNSLGAFKTFKGNFVEGKKEGSFEIKGKYVGVDYGFLHKSVYKNDIEFSKVIVYDESSKKQKIIDDYRVEKEANERAEKQAMCNNCKIDWKKSSTPKDEYTLWIKTGRKSGEIRMLNGDIYKFDFDKGKCKVINSWFESDKFYNTFDIMVAELLQKCNDKYCR